MKKPEKEVNPSIIFNHILAALFGGDATLVEDLDELLKCLEKYENDQPHLFSKKDLPEIFQGLFSVYSSPQSECRIFILDLRERNFDPLFLHYEIEQLLQSLIFSTTNFLCVLGWKKLFEQYKNKTIEKKQIYYSEAKDFLESYAPKNDLSKNLSVLFL